MPLKYLLFYVKDLDASRDFYEKLGAQVLKEDGVVLSVSLCGQEVWLLDESRAAFKMESEPTPRRGAGVFPSFSVDDLDEFHGELFGRGLVPSSEPKNLSWGREFVIKDPDGYVLVFAQS